MHDLADQVYISADLGKIMLVGPRTARFGTGAEILALKVAARPPPAPSNTLFRISGVPSKWRSETSDRNILEISETWSIDDFWRYYQSIMLQ